MSETPKFDFSRIRLGNGAGKYKASEIALPKNNVPDTVKASEVEDKKTDTADTFKTSGTALPKINTADTFKASGTALPKTNTADTVKAYEVATQKINTADTVKTSEVATQKINSSEQKNLPEAAKEIQELLAPLKETYPTNSAYEKLVFVNKFREEIRTNFRVQKVITDGGMELIKILCQPLDIPVEMGKKWLQTAQHYQ
jgi:ABC-type Na+ efflux pump permease subunit